MELIRQSVRQTIAVRKIAESCRVGAKFTSNIKHRRVRIFESEDSSDLQIDDEVIVKSVNPETSEAIVTTDKGEELVVATESLLDGSLFSKVNEAETKNQFGEEIAMINKWFKNSDYPDGHSYWWNGKKLKIQDEEENEVDSFSREDLAKEIDGFPKSVSIKESREEGIELPNTNLRIVGLDNDVNGNRVIKVSAPNGNAFSIQTNGNLPKTHEIASRLKYKEFKNVVTDDQIRYIRGEIVNYVRKFGSPKQKSSMKNYGDVFEAVKPDSFDAETGKEIVDYIKNGIKVDITDNYFDVYYKSNMGGTVDIDFNKEPFDTRLDWMNTRTKLSILIQRENNTWYADCVNYIKGIKFPSVKDADLNVVLKKIVDWLNKNLVKYQNA